VVWHLDLDSDLDLLGDLPAFFLLEREKEERREERGRGGEKRGWEQGKVIKIVINKIM
jgi:hypothetical protein